MVNYDKSTGSSGTMRITDTGTKIQFWLKAGSATFNYSLGYGFTVNGVTDNTNTFRFEKGGAWQMLRQWTVSTSQNIVFRLQDTGTSGLGGPTTHNVVINRDTIPDPPSPCIATNITGTSVFISFSDPSDNGGDAIDARQIAYRKTTVTTLTSVSSDRSTNITGLSTGTSYYFWARVRNSEGWSAYGPRITVKTLDEPGPPGIVSLSQVTQTSLLAAFVDGPTNGSVILQRQIGYNLSSTATTPSTILEYSGATRVTGLLPARTYYFRSRTRNSVGWSTWSASRSTTTLSGARIKVNGVWKHAIPYVKVGGVWRVARPWGRQFGYWEEST